MFNQNYKPRPQPYHYTNFSWWCSFLSINMKEMVNVCGKIRGGGLNAVKL